MFNTADAVNIIFQIINNFTKFNQGEYYTNEVVLPCALSILNFRANLTESNLTESKGYLTTLLFRIAQYYTHFKEHRLALGHLERFSPYAKKGVDQGIKGSYETSRGKFCRIEGRK